MTITAGNMVGKVTQARYDELVADGLEQLAVIGRAQFRLGDNALEIEPMNPRGGWHAGPGDESLTVRESLGQYAADIDVPLTTLLDRRWVASRWPKKHRRDEVAFTVHKALAAIVEEEDRFARILDTPWHQRSGTRRWTLDEAKRVVGQRVGHPATVAEKTTKVHDLLEDPEVAAQVATDLLQRPRVVVEVVEDGRAMDMVNKAQADRSHRIAAERLAAVPKQTRTQIERAREHVRHHQEYFDLIGACAAFVSAAGRVVPALRGHSFTEEERDRVHENLARVRGAADWIENAVDTGNLSLDEGFAALLRDQ